MDVHPIIWDKNIQKVIIEFKTFMIDPPVGPATGAVWFVLTLSLNSLTLPTVEICRCHKKTLH